MSVFYQGPGGSSPYPVSPIAVGLSALGKALATRRQLQAQQEQEARDKLGFLIQAGGSPTAEQWAQAGMGTKNIPTGLKTLNELGINLPDNLQAYGNMRLMDVASLPAEERMEIFGARRTPRVAVGDIYNLFGVDTSRFDANLMNQTVPVDTGTIMKMAEMAKSGTKIPWDTFFNVVGVPVPDELKGQTVSADLADRIAGIASNISGGRLNTASAKLTEERAITEKLQQEGLKINNETSQLLQSLEVQGKELENEQLQKAIEMMDSQIQNYLNDATLKGQQIELNDLLKDTRVQSAYADLLETLARTRQVEQQTEYLSEQTLTEAARRHGIELDNRLAELIEPFAVTEQELNNDLVRKQIEQLNANIKKDYAELDRMELLKNSEFLNSLAGLVRTLADVKQTEQQTQNLKTQNELMVSESKRQNTAMYLDELQNIRSRISQAISDRNPELVAMLVNDYNSIVENAEDANLPYGKIDASPLVARAKAGKPMSEYEEAMIGIQKDKLELEKKQFNLNEKLTNQQISQYKREAAKDEKRKITWEDVKLRVWNKYETQGLNSLTSVDLAILGADNQNQVQDVIDRAMSYAMNSLDYQTASQEEKEQMIKDAVTLMLRLSDPRYQQMLLEREEEISANPNISQTEPASQNPTEPASQNPLARLWNLLKNKLGVQRTVITDEDIQRYLIQGE
jgi:hypothetical protein